MAVRDFRSQRIFVDADLDHNTSINTSREQANYLLNVLRLKTGAQILVFNGRQGEWIAEVIQTGRKGCDLKLLKQTREQTRCANLTYCFAPLKQARLDYMIQKAVEMGVGALQPVITEYTQVRTLKQERIRSNIIEAAEQCGILALPELREPVALSKLPEAIGDALLVFCDEDRSSANDLDGLAAEQQVAVLIGPEGGFSSEERNFINSHDRLVYLGLGPRILRADTAAVAALAILQSSWGDWYRQKPE